MDKDDKIMSVLRAALGGGRVEFNLFDENGKNLPVLPVIDKHVVSLALGDGAVLYSEADYSVALKEEGRREMVSFKFCAPKVESALCSVQFGPVELCCVTLSRSGTNIFAREMENIRRQFPMLPSQPAVLLCVSNGGVTVVESDRDILLLPSGWLAFALVFAGMSDALVRDLVLGLPSQAACSQALTWVLQHGGTIGPLTFAASLAKQFECKHLSVFCDNSL